MQRKRIDLQQLLRGADACTAASGWPAPATQDAHGGRHGAVAEHRRALSIARMRQNGHHTASSNGSNWAKIGPWRAALSDQGGGALKNGHAKSIR
jgi:hypothetical protein